MQWVFKVGYKKLVPDLIERLKYWSDYQLVDIRPSETYPAKMGKHFCIIEDGKDYWKVRGTTDWKSTKKSVYDLKKYLYVADANGRYPWDAGYNENTVPARKRDWFLDYKSLLDSKLIFPDQFDQIYDKSREGIIVLERDIPSLLTHEGSKTRLQSIYSDKTGTIAQNGTGSGTGGGFTIGAAGDYATLTAFEADIAAQLTGNLHGLHLNEATAITTDVAFDTDTNSFLLKLTAEVGAEHDGGAYGNGARIAYGTFDSLTFSGATLDDIEISKLALDITGSDNDGLIVSSTAETCVCLINRLLVAGSNVSDYGMYVNATLGSVLIKNNILYGVSTDTQLRVLRSVADGVYEIYNNTSIGGNNNFLISVASTSTCTVKNNLAQACVTLDYSLNNIDVSGTNISEDATSPDAAYRSKDVHTNSVFLNYGANDYRLNVAGDSTNLAILDDGENLSGTFTDDIQGQVRSTWYIGASEIVAAGLLIPIARYHYANAGGL